MMDIHLNILQSMLFIHNKIKIIFHHKYVMLIIIKKYLKNVSGILGDCEIVFDLNDKIEIIVSNTDVMN